MEQEQPKAKAKITGVISECDLDQEEKNFVAMLINRFGTGGHPVADSRNASFNYFMVKYAMECLWRGNNTGDFTDEGYEMMSKVYSKLQAYLDTNDRILENK
jgi:hypothetical protein